MPVFTCLNCHKNSEDVCACCKNSFYCGKECHDEDWKIRHRYESFLFKAREPVELSDEKDREREKKKRIQIEKLKTESDLLREEYQEMNRKLTKATQNKSRTKREMAMTHEQRKRFEFNLMMGLKEAGLREDREEFAEYIQNMEGLVVAMNEVPLRNGEARNITLGPKERVEIGHLILRKKILQLRLALMLVTKSSESSREAIAYKQMIDEKEGKFTFNLFIDESDGITYDEVIANAHKGIEKHLIDSWIEKAYEKSIMAATEKTIEFIDQYRNDPDSKGHNVVGKEQHEKELEYAVTRMTVVKNCALQFALSTTRNSLSNGLITEEVYHNAVRHYQELSDRVDSMIEEEKDQIEEDMERVLRRYYGNDEWFSVKSFLFHEASGTESELGERMGLGVNFLDNFFSKKTKKILWIMFVTLFLVTTVSYFMALITYSFTGAADLDSLNDQGELVNNELIAAKATLTTVQTGLRGFNETLDGVIERVQKMRPDLFITHCFEGISNTTSQIVLDTINLTVDKLFEVIKNEIDRLLNSTSKNNLYALENLDNIGFVLEKYRETDAADFVTRSMWLEEAGNLINSTTNVVTETGMALSHDFIKEVFDQLQILMAGIGIGVTVLGTRITTSLEKSTELKNSIKIFNDKYRDNVRRPVIVPYLLGTSNGYGYNTLEGLIKVANSNSTLEKATYTLGEGFTGWRNSAEAMESHFLQAVDTIPYSNTTHPLNPIMAITNTVFSKSFLHGQMLFYNLVTTWGFTTLLNKLGFVIEKTGVKTVIKNGYRGLVSGLLNLNRWTEARKNAHQFNPDSINKVKTVFRDIRLLRAEGRYNSFYDFFDIMNKYDLTTEESIAVWYETANIDSWDSHDIVFAEQNLWLNQIYYHGIDKLSYLFTGVAYFYKFKIAWEFFSFFANYIPLLITWATGIESPFGTFMMLWFIVIAMRFAGVFGYHYAKKGTTLFIRKFIAENYKSDENEDENVNWNLSKNALFIEHYIFTALQNPGQLWSLASGLLQFAYSTKPYINIISSVVFMLFFFISLVPGMEKLGKLKEIFFGWGEPTENMQLGRKIVDDYQNNITAYSTFSSTTTTVTTAFQKFIADKPITSSDIILSNALPTVMNMQKKLNETIAIVK